jgi:hypothetical protein
MLSLLGIRRVPLSLAIAKPTCPLKKCLAPLFFLFYPFAGLEFKKDAGGFS